MVENIYKSREKDYLNPFRLMVYGNEKEMDKVVGSLHDNPFILHEQASLDRYKKRVAKIVQRSKRVPNQLIVGFERIISDQQNDDPADNERRQDRNKGPKDFTKELHFLSAQTDVLLNKA